MGKQRLTAELRREIEESTGALAAERSHTVSVDDVTYPLEAPFSVELPAGSELPLVLEPGHGVSVQVHFRSPSISWQASLRLAMDMAIISAA